MPRDTLPVGPDTPGAERSQGRPVWSDETASMAAGTGPLRLVATCGGRTAVHDLPDRGTLRIGRDKTCQILVDDESVSRFHAMLHVHPTLRIEDTGSRNGTRLLGTAIPRGELWPLAPGSIIQVGRAVLVVERMHRVQEADLRRADETIVIASPAMAALFETLDVIAAATLSVLVLGETGSGKEVVARAVHDRSPRAHAPFVALNCAALPEPILESELFGYAKGAFTGAAQAKPGLFEMADEGTIFLDEVGEMSLATQAKLLRVLENGEFSPLGSVRQKKVDVRVVAATNRDLRALVEASRFREDLYFRLDGMTIRVPALRERVQDIEPLAEYFLERTTTKLARPRPRLASSAVAALQGHSWPGNVRELRNVIERAVVLAQGAPSIDAAHICLGPPRVSTSTADENSSSVPGQTERERIIAALARAAGNQKLAAKMLGVSRRTLIRRIEEYAITRPRKSQSG